MHVVPTVSVIVVSFNTRELTLEAVGSALEQTTRHQIEILVWDNASSDGSAKAIVERFGDRVRVVAGKDNLGFGAANNEAAKLTSAPWLLLLNPDTVVLDGAIDTLVDAALAEPECGIFGGRTVFADGRLNAASAWAEPTPLSMVLRGLGVSAVLRKTAWANPEVLPGWDRSTRRHVDIVSGCFLLIRRDLWESLGGFDARFKIYAEEFDLCIRARSMGANPLIVPEATIVHLGGASDTVKEDQIVRQFRGRSLLFGKHWSPTSAWIGRAGLTLWALNKLIRARLLRRSPEAQTWSRIWKRRREWTHLA